MQAFEYKGVWWLPATQERQIAGTVKFVGNDQIVLSLEGLLEPVRPHERLMELSAYALILGKTSEGQAITLIDCLETLRSGEEKQTHIATIACIGAHFLSPQAISFQAIDIHYSYLAQWAGVFPYIGYQQPFEEITATTDRGKISVRSVSSVLGPDFIQERDFLSEERLSEAVCMHVEAAQPLSLEEWGTQFTIPLQNLLTLATQRANTVIHLRAYLLHDDKAPSSQNNLTSVVQIVYPEARQITEPQDPLSPDELFFSLNDVAARLNQVMDTWLKIEEELDSVSDLYFGVQYMKLYLDQRFLFIAQAAESLQSRRTERLDHPEVEHQSLIAILMAACPEQYKEWLAEQLEYSNKASFRKKLKLLYDSTKVILAPLIGSKGKDRDTFADRVYHTRNYLTHYDKALKSKAAKGRELLFLMDLVNALRSETSWPANVEYCPQS